MSNQVTLTPLNTRGTGFHVRVGSKIVGQYYKRKVGDEERRTVCMTCLVSEANAAAIAKETGVDAAKFTGHVNYEKDVPEKLKR